MTATEQARFQELYTRQLRALKLRGMSENTIDSYARAVRRVSSHFDCCPDQLTVEQLEVYFADLVDSHSWSTVKIDRNGLQFFWKYVLNPSSSLKLTITHYFNKLKFLFFLSWHYRFFIINNRLTFT